jgi:hypothetical protein
LYAGSANVPAQKKVTSIASSTSTDNVSSSSLSLISLNINQQTTPSSIKEYLDSVHKMANEIVFFQWNSTGILQRISSYEHQYHKIWIPETVVIKPYQHTKPSKYGSVAMVLNTDTIRGIDFDSIPPIPLLVYTIPKHVPSSMFQVIPNPYDYKGNSVNDKSLTFKNLSMVITTTTIERTTLLSQSHWKNSKNVVIL